MNCWLPRGALLVLVLGIANGQTVAMPSAKASVASQRSARLTTGQPSGSAIALVGGTLIDGTGRPPVADATVVVMGARIVAAGPRSQVSIPTGARIINASGQFLTPGFVDTNVHLSLYYEDELLLLYRPQFTAIAIEVAQLYLKHGVTTVRDTYGMLQPLLTARDTFARGKLPGPRLYVAGNIVGLGGPWSYTFSGTNWNGGPLSFSQEQLQDAITQGMGEELLHLEPDSLRVMMGKYLDKGVDFVKYGGTTHTFPALIPFSPRAQAVIVEETHKRHKVVDTHATSPEGLRLAVQAGIDVIQHPERLDAPLSDDLAHFIVTHHVVCAMFSNMVTGEVWTRRRRWRESTDSAARRLADSLVKHPEIVTRPQTGAERRAAEKEGLMEYHRANAEKLIRNGCTVSVATDATAGMDDAEFRRSPLKGGDEILRSGIGTLKSIEGLVELGMTPMQALVAATRNGAIASKALTKYGTIEPGKAADLLLLRGNPLADIRNIEKLSLVMMGGEVIDTAKLPTQPVFFGRKVAQPVP